jgi:hypothetical protein
MMKETLVSICALLNKHQVEYLVIGGVAVIYHGYTRATSDIDFWYKPSIQNFNKIIEAYREYGIDVSSLEKVVFDPKTAYLRFPTQFRTELLPAVAGELSFMEAQKASEILELEGVKIPVIGYNHLIQTKLLTNRLKDKADAEELAKRKKGHAGQ